MRRRADITGVEDPALARAILTYTLERERSGRVQPSTARRMRYDLLRWARSCGQPPKRVNTRHIERYLDTKRSHGSKRTTLSDIRGFCVWAVGKGMMRADPTAQVDIGRPPKSAPRSLSEEQATAVLAAAGNPRDRLIVLLMLHLGLRAKEVAEMEIGDIDMRRCWVGVRGKGGRGGVTRTVPIPAEAHAALQAYLRESPATAGPLVRSMTRPGQPIQARTITILLTELFWEAGVKTAARDGRSGHGLRHTCLTDLADRGAPVQVIQEIAGHADLKTTQIYISGHNPDVKRWIEGREYGA